MVWDMEPSAIYQARPLNLRPYRGPVDDPPPPNGGGSAAVALILRPPWEAPVAEFLLIRRAAAEGDPWSGHMALPGGRRQEDDASLLGTAIRETLEETGIDLAAAGSLMGTLAPVEPVSPQLPAISILPLVFRLEHRVELRLRKGEVAEAIWAPVSLLESPESRAVHHHEEEGIRLAFPAFQVEGRTVWGLTHRILTDFRQRQE
jgi:8-oxo-dGTP pyrophosphatase MutT (NUDIX family)